MTRKENLIYLLQAYYKGEYDTSVFCDLFVEIYSDGVDDPGMSRQEKTCMEEFCRLAERYSPFEDDLKMSAFFVDEETFKEAFRELYGKYFSVLK